MNKVTIELIREWIQAEIKARLEAIEEDSDGYRGCSNHEQKEADRLFNEIKKMVGN